MLRCVTCATCALPQVDEPGDSPRPRGYRAGPAVFFGRAYARNGRLRL